MAAAACLRVNVDIAVCAAREARRGIGGAPWYALHSPTSSPKRSDLILQHTQQNAELAARDRSLL